MLTKEVEHYPNKETEKGQGERHSGPLIGYKTMNIHDFSTFSLLLHRQEVLCVLQRPPQEQAGVGALL